MFKTLAKLYDYNNVSELLYSIFPSVKHKIFLYALLTSTWFPLIESLLGFKGSTIVAFGMAAFLELATGLYASIVVRKEDLKSHKLARFSMKFGVLLITFYCVNSFRKEFDGKLIIGEFFDWLWSAGFAYFAVEYLISVLENLSSISGKGKNEFVEAIRERIRRFIAGQ